MLRAERSEVVEGRIYGDDVCSEAWSSGVRERTGLAVEVLKVQGKEEVIRGGASQQGEKTVSLV